MIPVAIWIFPYTLAREFIPEAPTIAIRIFDPGETRASGNMDVPLVESEHWLAELKYSFADLDPTLYEMNGQKDIADRFREDLTCFNTEMAEEILEDFEESFFRLGIFGKDLHSSKSFPQLMIHCNAGLSRSPAVARALCEVFDLKPMWMGSRKTMMDKGHIGNRWIYNTLRNEV